MLEEFVSRCDAVITGWALEVRARRGVSTTPLSFKSAANRPSRSASRSSWSQTSDAEELCLGAAHLDVGSFGGGTPLLAHGIEDAEIMARDGITKKQVKEYLWEHASIPFANIPARRKGHKSDEDLLNESPNVTPDGVGHLATRPEDIMVVVLGGKHRHSVFLPMWTGRNTLSVIKPIRLERER